MTDAVICAAIHSSEPSFERRFGSFIPFLSRHVVWVGNGSAQELSATMAALERDAPGEFQLQGKACSRGGVLLHVEFGLPLRHHGPSIEAMLRDSEPLSARVLERRFQGPVSSTLKDICAKDANRCDREIAGRQLLAREVSGLCIFVLEEASNAYARSDRPWAKDPKAPFDEAATITACMKLPPEEKVCIVHATTRAERTACMTKLAPKLGL